MGNRKHGGEKLLPKVKVYWGEGGQYGPYSIQDDGWPNGGEVMHDFHQKSGKSGEEVAREYSEEVGEQVTADWIYKMEYQNRVPKDIDRRRAIAKILNIPLWLFGLESLKNIVYPPTTETSSSQAPQIPHTHVYSTLDLNWYNKEARILWKLHYAQTAQDSLDNLKVYIANLALTQQVAKGNLARHVNELMNSYYRLAATIERDLGHFSEAYAFANESVRLAKQIGETPYAQQIIAASQYTRGIVNLAWGVFGSHGNLTLHKEKIQAALFDFERALKHASPQLKGIIYSEMARAKALIAVSPTDVTIALKLIEQAEHYVGLGSSDDFYTEILLNGDLKGLDNKRLMLGRVKTFVAVKRPAKALEELADLELLRDGETHTRRRAWTHIFHAQASFDLGDYSTAIDETLSACIDCQEVSSVAHLSRVKELYTRLAASPYKADARVKRLRKLLTNAFSNVVE